VEDDLRRSGYCGGVQSVGERHLLDDVHYGAKNFRKVLAHYGANFLI
jgi:hypothetical protein